MRDKMGRFVDGIPVDKRHPIGAIRVRTRYKRNNTRRAFIKTAEPNTWVLLARFNWEQAYGSIPRGMGIHHVDENSLNDEIGNLRLVSNASHLSEHRSAYRERCLAALHAARRERRWSTKSKTKRVGRHPKNCQCPLHEHD